MLAIPASGSTPSFTMLLSTTKKLSMFALFTSSIKTMFLLFPDI